MEVNTQTPNQQEISRFAALVDDASSSHEFQTTLDRMLTIEGLTPDELRDRLDAGFVEAFSAQCEVVKLGDAVDDNMRARADALSLLAAHEGLKNKKVKNDHGIGRGRHVSGHELKLIQISAVVKYAQKQGDSVALKAIQQYCNAVQVEVDENRGSIDEGVSKLTEILNNPLVRRGVTAASVIGAVSITSLFGAGVAVAAEKTPAKNITPSNPSPHKDDVTAGKYVVKVTPKPAVSVVADAKPLNNNPTEQSPERSRGPVVRNIKPIESKPIPTPKPVAKDETARPETPPPSNRIPSAIDRSDEKAISSPDATKKSEKKPSVLKIKVLPTVPIEKSTPTPGTSSDKPAPATPEAPAPEVAPITPSPEVLTEQQQISLAAQKLIDRGGEWTNRGRLMKIFVDSGMMSPMHAVAFIGNFMVEAPGLHPGTYQENGDGRGFVQWGNQSNPAYDRFGFDGLRGLVKFANERGTSWDDFDTQALFVLEELKTTEKGAYNKIMATTTREEATLAVSKFYERPGIPHNERRVKNANIVADAYNEELNAIRIATQPPAEIPEKPTSNLPENRVGWPGTAEEAMEIFNQCDPRWGKILSPNGLEACQNSCGPTNVAMAASVLKPDLKITPKETIDYANKNRLWFTPAGKTPDSGGVTWDGMIQLAANWGISGNRMADSKIKDLETYRQIIKEGGIIIAAGSGPIPFVQPKDGAHFVTIRGVTEDGKFLVADPYPKTPDTNTVPWDADQMMNSIFGAIVLYNSDTVQPQGAIEKSSPSPSELAILEAENNTMTDMVGEKTQPSEAETQPQQDGLLKIDHTSKADGKVRDGIGSEGDISPSASLQAGVISTEQSLNQAAQAAADRAKRAVAAAKKATEQSQHNMLFELTH